MAGFISASQFERDHKGLRNVCAACGHDGTAKSPLIVDEHGSRVHKPEFIDHNGRPRGCQR